MTDLIIGLGEIGKAVLKTVRTNSNVVLGYDISHTERPLGITDVLHICFPYGPDFVEQVKDYRNFYKARHTLIWSTVPIGTTKQIPGAVHSPVEGRHPYLTDSIRTATRWLGGSKAETQFFASYFETYQIATRPVKNSDYTEALKLLSTTEYGINIEFARYKKEIADAIGMDYELAKQWNQDYNRLYDGLGLFWAQKYILDAPRGPKGGHCVTPNARLLDEQFPNPLTKIVGEL